MLKLIVVQLELKIPASRVGRLNYPAGKPSAVTCSLGARP